MIILEFCWFALTTTKVDLWDINSSKLPGKIPCGIEGIVTFQETNAAHDLVDSIVAYHHQVTI